MTLPSPIDDIGGLLSLSLRFFFFFFFLVKGWGEGASLFSSPLFFLLSPLFPFFKKSLQVARMK